MTIGLPGNRTTRLLRHLSAWALFIIYETGGIYLAMGSFGHLVYYALFYPLNIALFYINACWVMPLVGNRQGRKRLALIPAELLVYLAIKTGIDYLMSSHLFTEVPFQLSWNYLIFNFWRGLYFFGFSTFYWSILRLMRLREQAALAEKRQLGLLVERARLEQSLAELDNAYLRQQINPHFLFNALNFVYNAFYKLSEPAAACVSKLSDLLHYSFDQTDQDGKAELQAEIAQIRQLIEINRLRFRFPLFIELEVKGEISAQRIPPLVLLSLTENMFKYGNLKEKAHPAELLIEVNEAGRLLFRGINLKKYRETNQRRNPIGLANSIKRLNYAYPGNYELTIRDEAEIFGIELHINL